MEDPTAGKLEESELKKVLAELSSNIEECEHVAATLSSHFSFVLGASSDGSGRKDRVEREKGDNIIGYLKVLLNGVKETKAILKDTIDRSVI